MRQFGQKSVRTGIERCRIAMQNPAKEMEVRRFGVPLVRRLTVDAMYGDIRLAARVSFHTCRQFKQKDSLTAFSWIE